MDSNEEVREIRRLIKAKAPTVSVRRGRGTAYGWIEIGGSGEGGAFTDAERTALEAMGLSLGGNFCVIDPADRNWWLHKLAGDLESSGETCIGCDGLAIERFLCPCDLSHGICLRHKDLCEARVIRRDCADAPRWDAEMAARRAPVEARPAQLTLIDTGARRI